MTGEYDRNHETRNLSTKFARWCLPLAVMIAVGSIALSVWQLIPGSAI